MENLLAGCPDRRTGKWTVRPHCLKFLRTLRESFNIFLFTDGQKAKTQPLIDLIDPFDEYFAAKFFRESCTVVETLENKFYFKDLSVFKHLDTENCLLVDISLLSFALQLDVGVPVLPFYGHEKDNELLKLLNYLQTLGKSSLKAQNTKNIQLVTKYESFNKAPYQNNFLSAIESAPDSSFDSVLS